MLKMNKNWIGQFLLPALVMQFAPANALAGGELPAPRPVYSDGIRDLTADEAKSLFDMQVGTRGNLQRSEVSVKLLGRVYDACKDRFEFSNTGTGATSRLKSHGFVGFRVRDLGGGKACMERFKGVECSEKVVKDGQEFGNPCTVLSDIPGASIDLSNEGDVNVGMYAAKSGADQANPWTDIADGYKHKSRATVRAEAEKARADAREGEVTRLERQLTSCRGNLDQLAKARRALDQLARLDAIDEDKFVRMDNALVKRKYELLTRKFAACAATDEECIDSAAEELEAFVSEHDKYANQVATLMSQMAQKVAFGKKQTGEGFDRALALIERAKGLEGLSADNRETLETYPDQIAISKLKWEAKKGDVDPYSFGNDWQTMYNSAAIEMQSCSSSMEAMKSISCRAARSNLAAIQQLPAVAQRGWYDQYAIQARMQQQQLIMQQQMASFGAGSMFGSAFNGATIGGGGSGFLK